MDRLTNMQSDVRKPHQVTLLFSPFSGASHRRRRHAGGRPVTWAAAPPPEVQSWAELGPDRNWRPPPLQSRQGHYWLFYCQVPEKLTGGHVFSYGTISSHTRLQTGTIVFILRHSVCFDGPVLTKTRAVLFTASASQQLLSKTAGHIGISLINTEGRREGRARKRGGVGGRGGGTWGWRLNEYWQMQQC